MGFRRVVRAVLVIGIGLGVAAPAAAAEPAPDPVWERLAECESGGDWSINSGNGYYGGLQFDQRTWSAHGGTEHAALPHEAAPQQQVAVGEQLRDERGGFGAWPSCARQLDLPTG